MGFRVNSNSHSKSQPPTKKREMTVSETDCFLRGSCFRGDGELRNEKVPIGSLEISNRRKLGCRDRVRRCRPKAWRLGHGESTAADCRIQRLFSTGQLSQRPAERGELWRCSCRDQLPHDIDQSREIIRNGCTAHVSGSMRHMNTLPWFGSDCFSFQRGREK